MTPMDESVCKIYVDRSVQTETLGYSGPTIRMSEDASTGSTDVNSGEFEAFATPIGQISAKLEVLAIGPDTPDSEDNDAAGRPPSFSNSTARPLQRQQLPLRKPSSIPIAANTRRIVSLPETVSEVSVKKALQKSVKFRVVSMPERSKHGFDSSGDSPSSDRSFSGNVLLDDRDEPRARVRVRSSVTDTPHTPSPPSSPESVLIIGSKSQLSEGFLRGHAGNEPSPCSSISHDDEGKFKDNAQSPLNSKDYSFLVDWATWAKSPPRPIPALHGPLSLPYARCPSSVLTSTLRL